MTKSISTPFSSLPYTGEGIKKPLKIFLIAGEASGDVLGAKLMYALIQQSKQPLHFHGIGGEKMAEAGLISLLPMQELSLIGFIEIIPHIPNLLKRLRQTLDNIQSLKPDIVITIDAPGFNFRVARKLKEQNFRGKLVHYVAPSVWAYKPERALKIAKIYDYLLCLLPFEPPYFDKVGLANRFVGHPIVEEPFIGGDGKLFRVTYNINPEAPILCLMPGSRHNELIRHTPIFKETAEQLQKSHPALRTVLITTHTLFPIIEKMIAHWQQKPIIITSEARKEAYAASTLALAKSGTGTMELALAGVPMVITYRVHPLSAWMLRRMIKVNYVNLVNLILNKPAIPELLQESSTPANLAAALNALLSSETARKEQQAAMKEALAQLGFGTSPSPSEKAAEAVLRITE